MKPDQALTSLVSRFRHETHVMTLLHTYHGQPHWYPLFMLFLIAAGVLTIYIVLFEHLPELRQQRRKELDQGQERTKSPRRLYIAVVLTSVFMIGAAGMNLLVAPRMKDPDHALSRLSKMELATCTRIRAELPAIKGSGSSSSLLPVIAEARHDVRDHCPG